MAGNPSFFLCARVLSRGSSRQLDTSTRCSKARALHNTAPLSTDGVFSGLTAMRVAKPWIQALREQENGQARSQSPRPAEPAKELKPKKMSSSYHSMVRIHLYHCLLFN